MRSTNSSRVATVLAATAGLGLVLSACGTSADDHVDAKSPAASSALPRIEEMGTSSIEYTSLSQLADISSALVIAKPTGKQSATPLPASQGGTTDSAPTTFVEMRITKVLSGTLTHDVINVVTPGTDQNTGGPALLTGGPYLMYITPAMYAANEPVGGYVVSGGPAGVYGSVGGAFAKLDRSNAKLPATIDLTATKLPDTSKSEAELLAAGPR